MIRFPEEKFTDALEIPGELWSFKIECDGEESSPIVLDVHFTVLSERAILDDEIPF